MLTALCKPCVLVRIPFPVDRGHMLRLGFFRESVGYSVGSQAEGVISGTSGLGRFAVQCACERAWGAPYRE
jgi:hypothetical protein